MYEIQSILDFFYKEFKDFKLTKENERYFKERDKLETKKGILIYTFDRNHHVITDIMRKLFNAQLRCINCRQHIIDLAYFLNAYDNLESVKDLRKHILGKRYRKYKKVYNEDQTE